MDVQLPTETQTRICKCKSLIADLKNTNSLPTTCHLVMPVYSEPSSSHADRFGSGIKYNSIK